MSLPAERLYTYAEYLALEEASVEKHEYCAGAILAMSGGTPEHALIKTNVVLAFGAALRGHPCRPFDSDLRVRVPATTLATYPDLTVICGPLLRDEEDRNAATNPTLLVEVLSPSTAGYDRGEKLDHYLRIPTLQEVVLVDYKRRHVDVYRRSGPDTAERQGYGEGARIPLRSLGVEIELDALYEAWHDLG